MPQLRWKTLLCWLFLGISSSIGIQGCLESQFENEILEAVASNIDQRTEGLSEIDRIDTALQVCFYLQERRSEILSVHDFKSQKANHFVSSLQSFYVGTGACGYYSLFAARVFQKLGYRPKIVQQRVDGRWGAHITLSLPLKESSRLILVDPLFHHVFRSDNNSGCTLQEVFTNWTVHSKLVPKNYNIKYDYQQGWRHTNWDKFGIISRGIYKLGSVILGKDKMDLMSFRMWVIDPYLIQSIIAFSVSLFCLIFILLDIKRSGLLK